MPPLCSFNRTCLALAIGQAMILPTQAAVITVDSIDDPDEALKCTLRHAIMNASSNGYSGSDNCASGTVGHDTINIVKPGIITLSSEQLSIPTGTLTINGLGQDQTFIDGDNSYRVFRIDSATVGMNSLTIQGGNDGDGGGIRIEDSSLSLSHVTVTNNSAQQGGGIYANNSSVDLTDCIVSGNSGDSQAGGIYAESSTISLANCTVKDNWTSQYGGGLYAYDFSTITLSNSNVMDNEAYKGGGIFASESSMASLTNSTVSNNSAEYGGGVYAQDSSSVSLVNSTVSSNSAGTGGGGIAAYVSSSVSLVNSTVTGNLAGLGGGGIVAYSSSSVSLANSIVSGNTATNGAEVFNFTTAPLNTFLSNDANLFGDNSHTFAEAFTNFPPSAIGATDIVATDDAGPAGSHQPTALGSILHPLDDNGCATPTPTGCGLTHALVPNSPALDAADNTDCGPGKLIEFDQRGETREENACDIGAFEGFVDDSSCYVINGAGSKTIVFCL